MQRLATVVDTAGGLLRRSWVGWVWATLTALMLSSWLLGDPHDVLLPGVPSIGVQPPKRVVEVVVILGILGFLVSRPGLSSVIAGADPRATVLALVLIAGTGATQLGLLEESQVYPLARWTMYTQPTASLTYHDLVMLRDGEEIGQLPYARAMPTRSPRSAMRPIGALASDVNDGDADAEDRLAEWVESVAALPGVLPDDGPDRPDALRIDVCEVTEPARPGAVSCTPLAEVAVPPSQAGETR